ncbi:MAG: HlyD family efflux transporter periplasmic adaptor subunit, partial [Hyphomicrobiaceae bacterium]|nr:HlyD family efflux transporter periplasmic adaptor subunit [Hyphomicrobiaceae bacterium]
QDFKITFEAELEIVRHVTGGFGAQFKSLGEREQGLMSHFIDEIVRGSMTDVKETIARMDVPLTPVSTKSEEKPLAETPLQRWTSKTYVVPALYGVLGLLVFGYAALVAYTNIFHLVVESAVVGGRVSIIKAQADGRIIYKGMASGQLVKAGELIAHINDPLLEARIEKAAIEIKRKLAEQSFLQQQTGVASSRTTEIIRQKSGSLKNQRLRVRKISAEVKRARALHRSLVRRLRRGRTKRQRVANAKANLSKLRARLAKAKGVLKGRAGLVKRTGKSGLFGKQLVISNDPLYRARLELIKNEVELARHDHQILLKLRADRVINAPFAARIVDLPKYSSSPIMRGDVAVVLEPVSTLAITAFLTQSEILKVKSGDTASVFIPALDQSFEARIKSINRRLSFVNAKEQSYGWRPRDERNAQVILELSPKDLAKVQQLTTGLPAVIMFNDRETNVLSSFVLPGLRKSDKR